MSSCVADTHALIWYVLNDSRLSAFALSSMQGVVATGGFIFIPSISIVEIVY